MEIVSLKNVKYEELEIKNIEDSYNNTMDFEVENTHYYTLENGLVSHNTVSLMTQTTSGIEPVFAVSYKRRRKINPNDKDARVDFIDESGDSWEEYNVFHPKFFKWLKINGARIGQSQASYLTKRRWVAVIIDLNMFQNTRIGTTRSNLGQIGSQSIKRLLHLLICSGFNFCCRHQASY